MTQIAPPPPKIYKAFGVRFGQSKLLVTVLGKGELTRSLKPLTEGTPSKRKRILTMWQRKCK
jgi:hypothetical protein